MRAIDALRRIAGCDLMDSTWYSMWHTETIHRILAACVLLHASDERAAGMVRWAYYMTPAGAAAHWRAHTLRAADMQ